LQDFCAIVTCCFGGQANLSISILSTQTLASTTRSYTIESIPDPLLPVEDDAFSSCDTLTF